MVNADIQTLHEPDGSPVCNVMFDLSAEQLSAASHASGEIVLERHRGQSLEVDDVLALRELTGVRDELTRLADLGGNATMVLPLARFIVLHDAVDEWVASRAARGWLRGEDEDAMPLVDALLPPMASLRARAVTETLGSATAQN